MTIKNLVSHIQAHGQAVLTALVMLAHTHGRIPLAQVPPLNLKALGFGLSQTQTLVLTTQLKLQLTALWTTTLNKRLAHYCKFLFLRRKV
ncbi:hypothetical protein D3C85_821670 [compost metagenome]